MTHHKKNHIKILAPIEFYRTDDDNKSIRREPTRKDFPKIKRTVSEIFKTLENIDDYISHSKMPSEPRFGSKMGSKPYPIPDPTTYIQSTILYNNLEGTQIKIYAHGKDAIQYTTKVSISKLKEPNGREMEILNKHVQTIDDKLTEIKNNSEIQFDYKFILADPTHKK